MTHVGPLVSPLLIGRDDLLDLADERLAEAAAGRSRFVLVAGEAGIGKTRFLRAVIAKAQAAGFRVAKSDLAPQDRDVPGASVLDLARTMAADRRWAAGSRKILRLLDSTDAADTTPPPTRRRRLVRQVVDLLLTAIDGPVMLAFEDLQWADNLSLETLTELAKGARERPLLLVGAYRSDELAPGGDLSEWRARLLTQRTAEEAKLARLTLEETALMTTLILGTGLPAPRDVVAAVHERTDGVPLYIEELLGVLSEEQRTDSRAIRNAAVPDTLEDAILRRIGRLSPEAQAVARAGAVIGRCFIPGVLAGMMDRPADSLDGPLQELVDHHVLYPFGSPDRGFHDYRHQLLRDALYRSLSEADRRRLHARAGEFGAVLEGQSEIHASLHYERAGMHAQAFRAALHGARAAARLSSHREAIELYRRAVENMPDDLPTLEKAGVLAEYAGEAGAVEETDAGDWAAGQARELYAAAGDMVAAVEQDIGLAGFARRRARPLADRAAATRSALATLDKLPADDRLDGVRAMAHVEQSYILIEAMDLAGARRSLAAAAKESASATDETMGLWVTSLQGTVEVIAGKPGGLDKMAGVAREGRDRGLDDAGLTAYRDAAVTAARVLDYRRADDLIEEGLLYADAVEQSHCAHVMRSTRALVAWADGRWDDAVAHAQHSLADYGCERAGGMARWPLAYVALGRGEREVAREHLDAASAFAVGSGAPDMALAAAWGEAELAVLGGEHEAAVRLTQQALELARESGERARFTPLVVTGVRARISAGRPADAERWLAEVTGLLTGVRWYAGPALDHAAGLVSLLQGSTGAARRSLEAAVAGWDERPRTWESLWARLDLAGCLMRSSRYVEAARLIAEVRERAGAATLGAEPLVLRAVEMARRNRRHDTQEQAWHPLTAREYEVAQLIAGGLTNGEIAVELSVSPKTVSAHVEHVLAKLGAARRTEIASWVSLTARPEGAQPSAAVPAGVH